VADVSTARPGPTVGLGRRERVRADTARGTYRTFPARLPTLLTASAGGFIALGALGTAVRATAVAEARDDPKQVRALMGYRQGLGWVLAIIGLVLVVAAFGWLMRRRLLKLAAIGVTAGAMVLVVLRLLAFDDRARAWGEAARRAPRYIGFHAGFGWGAWALLLGAILAGFGILVGVLRELDLRRGVEG
jgi:amino acid transporter